MVGAVLQFLAQRRRSSEVERRSAPTASSQAAPSSSQIVAHSFAVAVTVAAGLALSDYAGLQRDYWVMLTVIVCVRLVPAMTASITLMRVLGTVAGAALGFAITNITGATWLAALPLFVFAAGMFSSRNANFVVFTLFLTSFIIVMLNLAYPGDQQLAITRIIDTCLGGALSLAASGVLWSTALWSKRQKV